MTRRDVRQSELIQRVVVMLRNALGLTDAQCFESMTPNLEAKVGGDYFVAVCPGYGTFDEGEQCAAQCTEYGSIDVAIYTRLQLDPRGHAEKRLHDSMQGMLQLKRGVLSALVGKDVTIDGDAAAIRHSLYAKQASAPMTMDRSDGGRDALTMMVITFGVEFDWDLEQEI